MASLEYNDRVRVAAAFEKKKMRVNKTALKEPTKRDKITSFISQQKSRQEFPPLVGTSQNRAPSFKEQCMATVECTCFDVRLVQQ